MDGRRSTNRKVKVKRKLKKRQVTKLRKKIVVSRKKIISRKKVVSRKKIAISRKRKVQESPPEIPPPPLPILKQSDDAKLLPRYNDALENGVEMEDLNQLQRDLEKLITTCAVRNRLLVSQLSALTSDNTEKPVVKRKRGRPFGTHSQVKRRRQVLNKTRNSALQRNILNLPPSNNNLADNVPAKHKVPIISYPTNSASDFWLFVEPFCADVTNDNITFLDELIHECSDEICKNVPELGENYVMKWSDEMLSQENNYKMVGRPSKAKNLAVVSNIRKNEMNIMIDKFSVPITERLFASILEEKVVQVPVNPVSDILKSDGTAKPGDCMAERLRSELVEHEILEDDGPKQDDEILKEIERCQSELEEVNQNSKHQLNKLRTMIAQDRRRQAVKEALDDVDKRIIEIYNNILVAKQTHASQHNNHGPLNLTLTKQAFKEFEKEASDIINKQIRLHKEIIQLTNNSSV